MSRLLRFMAPEDDRREVPARTVNLFTRAGREALAREGKPSEGNRDGGHRLPCDVAEDPTSIIPSSLRTREA